MAKITTQELYGKYAAGERDFSGIDLSDCCLWIYETDGYDPTKNVLTGINLSRANLTKASIIEVNLAGANLSGADLSRAELGCSNLTGANLRGTNLTLTQFTCTNLTDADLSDTINICTASFDGANLTRANLRNCFGDTPISGSPETLLSNTIMPNGKIMTGEKWVD